MTSTDAPRRGRPPRLSIDAIIDTTARLIRDNGVDAVTMRLIAHELGATPMALYRHVESRDALLVAVLGREVSSLDRPSLSDDPAERVEGIFIWLYDELDARPWVVEVLSRGDLYAPSIRWAIDEILAGFVDLGLSPTAAVDGYLTVWRYIVGTLIIKHRSLATASTLDRDTVQTSAMQQADAADYPLIAATGSYWPHARTAFDYVAGIHVIVAGLTGAS